MPNDIVFKAIGFALIWFSVILVLVVLLISQARECSLGHSFRGALAFAIAISGLCAFIALGMVAGKISKRQVFSHIVQSDLNAIYDEIGFPAARCPRAGNVGGCANTHLIPATSRPGISSPIVREFWSLNPMGKKQP